MHFRNCACKFKLPTISYNAEGFTNSFQEHFFYSPNVFKCGETFTFPFKTFESQNEITICLNFWLIWKLCKFTNYYWLKSGLMFRQIQGLDYISGSLKCNTKRRKFWNPTVVENYFHTIFVTRKGFKYYRV